MYRLAMVQEYRSLDTRLIRNPVPVRTILFCLCRCRGSKHEWNREQDLDRSLLVHGLDLLAKSQQVPGSFTDILRLKRGSTKRHSLVNELLTRICDGEGAKQNPPTRDLRPEA